MSAATAGYSGTPLVRKLGIKAGFRVRFVNAPDGFEKLLGPLPDGVDRAAATRGTFDFIHLFVTRRAELDRRFGALKKALAADGMLWVSWPKKTSPMAGELTGDVVRATGLSNGLVDVKVCAVDHDWSGLKFVLRRRDRR